MNGVYVVDGVRTHAGRYAGALSGTRPDDLAAAVIAALAERSNCQDQIEEVTFGSANGAGEENRNVARMATLLAGLDVGIPGSTVNRLCGSGMEAVCSAARCIALGETDVCIAGGVESMSRAPWVMLKSEKPFDASHQRLWSSAIGWRMVNPKMPDDWTVSMGEGAEILAEKYGISRDLQDRFALGSHEKAMQAWQSGLFDGEVIASDGIALERDETIRPTTTLDDLARLRPSFRPDGSVTAGNSSPLSDGAAGVLLASERGLQQLGREPLARVVSNAVTALEPQYYGLGPVDASRKALARADIQFSDLTVAELNEAFAAQTLACLEELPELDRERVNPNGGAIALGHPLGCSGARLISTLAHELKRRKGGFGLATMCIGVGQGIAMVVEGL